MERITVTITADTHDTGAEILKHLDEWLSCIGRTVTVDISVKPLSLPDYFVSDDVIEEWLKANRR